MKNAERTAPSASDAESIVLVMDMLILDKQMPFIKADSVDRKTLEESVCVSLVVLYGCFFFFFYCCLFVTEGMV